MTGADEIRNADESFLQEWCLPFLCRAQNPDGGWGERPGYGSAVEPTAWTLLALSAAGQQAQSAERVERGKTWLRNAQLPDGSWPACVKQGQGCWVTSIAAWALALENPNAPEVQHGAAWLSREVPGDGSRWWRIRQGWMPRGNPVRQNWKLWGWSWTHGTSSWVEPTSYTLLFLRGIRLTAAYADARPRIQRAEAMLFDRMCPGGGWNCGNPMVYGAAGEPQVLTTAWALMALHRSGHNPQIQQSLTWLARGGAQADGPATAAIAHATLGVYGYPTDPLGKKLLDRFRSDRFLESVRVAAWCALALQSDSCFYRD